MFRVVLISREENFPGEAELINQLMAAGDFNFHLRKKTLDEKEIKKLLYKVDPVFFPRIIVHQHFAMEQEFLLGGIHLPESLQEQQEELKKAGHRIVSSSVHLLKSYEELRKNFSYIFFSPVFPSISKPGYAPIYSPEVFHQELSAMRNKTSLIALGGINEQNIAEVKRWGFGGAALLGSVWENKNPVKYFQEFLRLSSGASR